MASEIRVNKLNSQTGVGTISLSPTGVDISGITTAETLKATTGIVTTLTATTGIVTTLTTNTTRATTGIVTTLTATTGIVTTLTTNTLTANSTAKVGSGVTLSPDGDVFVTGVTTSSTVKVGGGVTISESGIEASGIGITCANINGQQISGRRNLIINGEMKICQRQGTTSLAVTNENKYVLDRWYVGTASGGGTSLNVQQQHGNPTGAPYGYAASMKMTVAVADDGGSDSFNVVQTRIENLDTNYLAFGTSQAKTVTLQFYVKSSLTGTFGGSLVSGDFSKGYVFQYTINSADTWEKKVITIPGDTASTADSVYNRGSATSARGLVLYFDLGSGTNSEKSAANDWTATATWGYAARISGNVKLCANAGADWSLTGVQLEVGSQATEFEHRSFGDEMSLCQRYYYQNTSYGTVCANDSGETINTAGFLGIVMYSSTSGRTPFMIHPVRMRAAPTINAFSASNANGGRSNVMSIYSGSTGWDDVSANSTNVTDYAFGFKITTVDSFTAGETYLMGGQFSCDAEL